MEHKLTITQVDFGLKGKVFRSPLPHGAYDPNDSVPDEWQAQAVGAVFSLIEDQEWLTKARHDLRPWMAEQGMQQFACPIMDFSTPADTSSFQSAAASALRLASAGMNIVIHCNAGWGRTGLFLSEMAVQHFGCSVDEAVAWVRQFVPHAVENEIQLRFLYQLHPQSA